MADPKHALREATRAARRGLDPAERIAASERASAHLLALPEVRHAATVLLYAATDDECDPVGAQRGLREAGATVLLPRVVGQRLELCAVGDVTLLTPGAFGILSPDGPAVSPEEVDVAVVPGLAFDRRGGRLGMGGGFYDRLLADLRDDCLRVGFAFACQMAVRVPMAPHDQGVDVVVTESAVHRISPPPPATA